MKPIAHDLNGNSVLIRRWLRREAHREQQQLRRHNDNWVPHHQVAHLHKTQGHTDEGTRQAHAIAADQAELVPRQQNA